MTAYNDQYEFRRMVDTALAAFWTIALALFFVAYGAWRAICWSWRKLGRRIV